MPVASSAERASEVRLVLGESVSVTVTRGGMSTTIEVFDPSVILPDSPGAPSSGTLIASLTTGV
jgi:hypothetical protein